MKGQGGDPSAIALMTGFQTNGKSVKTLDSGFDGVCFAHDGGTCKGPFMKALISQTVTASR